MTVVRIELSNNERLDLLLAFLRRLGSSEEVRVAIEQSEEPALTSSPEEEARFEAMINQIVEDALAGRLERLTPEEEEREQRELAAYSAERSRESGILTDDAIVRMINEDRRERREKAVA
ncbi:MAG: hypothetical protein ACKVX9_14730 [Blastocatellia bacterium]